MNKEKQYNDLLPQLKGLIQGEKNVCGILANVSAMLHSAFPDRFFWTGFYLKSPENSLILGPFQGTVACYTIPFGKGVCGSAWQEGKTLVVKDVEEFPGHIACSSLSRSEIVVPLYKTNGDFYGVLDIDSTRLADFDNADKQGLEMLMQALMEEISPLC